MFQIKVRAVLLFGLAIGTSLTNHLTARRQRSMDMICIKRILVCRRHQYYIFGFFQGVQQRLRVCCLGCVLTGRIETLVFLTSLRVAQQENVIGSVHDIFV